MPSFRYDDAILERFPTIAGGVIHAIGVTNGPTPAALGALVRDEATTVRARLGQSPLSEVPSLAAWRKAFRAFGVDPTQYRSAAEALLRRLVKQGDLPAINALVDMANLVSIRHALPVAVLDRRGIVGCVTVRFATGAERWTDLGSSATEHPELGEVVFVDDAGVACARRWCWRQSLATAASGTTTEVLITVEGHHAAAAGDVAAAVAELELLLEEHVAPAGIRHGFPGAGSPSFD